jgi:hypothetical protein
MEKKHETITVKLPFIPSFRYAVGKSMTKFLDSFKNKKIIGIKCPSCDNVYVPPRNICGRCCESLSEFVELPNVGVVENLTKAYVTVASSGEIKELKEPKVCVLVRLDGATSSIFGEILGNDVKIGDKVEVVWKDEPKGDWKDIVGFRVVSS